MQYDSVTEGVFISRPNRFIAHVELQGEPQTVHVKNTGRCRELLIPGARVYLQRSSRTDRKTAYDLIAVRKGDRLINMDSQIPNAAAEEWIRAGGLFPDLRLLKREVAYGDSRFDLYAEHGGGKAFIEVKGVTLEEDGVVRFPDAPTERGVKHLKELIRCHEEGCDAYILFVIQMQDVRWFEPNTATHPAFADALRQAAQRGVHVLAYDCLVQADRISVNAPVKVRL